MNMKISKTVIGDYVKFANPENGYKPNQELAAEHLVVGCNYRIKDIAVHDWRTDVYLVDFPEIAFNSVMFDNIAVFADKEKTHPITQGYCPKCGSDDLAYDGIETCGEGACCPYKCLECGLSGEEHYSLEFTGHNDRETDKFMAV
ncbi:MAG: hypothetical protein KAS32_10630 [Candidatus Peribacteraceae bacterium]|nr:hypothetical protein [Candidatus Peribacteraceae bacterium]